MTSTATIKAPPSLPAETAKFGTLRSGLLRAQYDCRRYATLLPQSEWLLHRAEDHLHCLALELQILEEYSPKAIGPVQQDRLERLCQNALSVTTNVPDSHTDSSSRTAFASLEPSVSRDFERFTKSPNPPMKSFLNFTIGTGSQHSSPLA
jgi:hypothetical protein